MDDKIIQAARGKMEKAVDYTRDEMAHVRTGKATPTLLDTVRVDYYGQVTPLKQLAGISAPEARLLVVQPYDKSMLAAIEKAILASDLGLNPQNDGRVVRVPIPILSAERREELIRFVRKLAEEGRIAIRNIRREFNEQVKTAEKSGDISEDTSRRLLDSIQTETDKHISEIDALLKTREEDIRHD